MKKYILVVFVSSFVFVLIVCGGGDGGLIFVIVDDGVFKNNIVNLVVRVEVYIDVDINVNVVLDSVSSFKILMIYLMCGVNGSEM